MPTPERTSLDAILQAGLDLLETHGVAGLTMQAVATRVGVRAPSLYKRVQGRDDLLRRIVEVTAADLGARLDAADTQGADPGQDLVAVARELRAFARARPAAYRLLFDPESEASRPDVGVLATASGPVLRIAAALAGPDYALEAARTLTAWAHGFVTMELAGAFRLGGDVDRAFDYGLERLASALAARV